MCWRAPSSTSRLRARPPPASSALVPRTPTAELCIITTWCTASPPPLLVRPVPLLPRRRGPSETAGGGGKPSTPAHDPSAAASSCAVTKAAASMVAVARAWMACWGDGRPGELESARPTAGWSQGLRLPATEGGCLIDPCTLGSTCRGHWYHPVQGSWAAAPSSADLTAHPRTSSSSPPAPVARKCSMASASCGQGSKGLKAPMQQWTAELLGSGEGDATAGQICATTDPGNFI